MVPKKSCSTREATQQVSFRDSKIKMAGIAPGWETLKSPARIFGGPSSIIMLLAIIDYYLIDGWPLRWMAYLLLCLHHRKKHDPMGGGRWRQHQHCRDEKLFSSIGTNFWDGPDKNTILSKASIQHNSVDGRGCLLGSYCGGELLHHVHSRERESIILLLLNIFFVESNYSVH